MDKIDVSVVLVTYNHEKYIREAIESIINQETSFKYEIVIADDGSTDNTIEIIREYYSYNRIIRVISDRTNVGTTKNFIRGIENCKGKYVAFLEGDDSWIGRRKLATQYSIINNSDYSTIAHRTIYMSEGVEKGVYPHSHRSITIKSRNQFLVYKLAGLDFHLNSIFTLKENLLSLKSSDLFINNRNIFDFPLKVFLSDFGSILVVPEVFSKYRLQSNNGAYSSRKEDYRKKQHNIMKIDLHTYYFKDASFLKCFHDFEGLLHISKFDFSKKLIAFIRYFISRRIVFRIILVSRVVYIRGKYKLQGFINGYNK